MKIIELQNYNNQTILINPDGILKIEEAGASSQWHGIKSFVKLFDGTTIECSNDVKYIQRKLMENRE